MSRISQEGRTVVVLAAGNWGWAGTFSAAAPAAARGILVVGAVNAEHIHNYAPRARFEVARDGDTGFDGLGRVEEFAWSPAPPSRFPESIQLRAVALNASVEEDACDPSLLPSPWPDFHGDVVLVRRGGCDFAQKLETIKAAGAEYALIYDNSPETDQDNPWSLVDADNTFHMRGVGFISASTGEHFIDLLSSGHKILMKLDSNFTLTPYISNPSLNTFPPGQIAPRGTWGPDGEIGLIPSILAPGIGIMSTFPRSWGGYNILSGTSMSAPYVAGCAALVRQAHPDMKAGEIVRRLMSTSRPIKFHDGSDDGKEYDFLAPTYKQGAGLVDCFAAATTTTEVSVSDLALGDAEFMAAEQEMHIVNSGQREALYRISHVPAASVDSLSNDRGRIVPMTLSYTDNVVSDEFLETLRPKQHVQMQIDAPPTQEINLLPGTEAAIRLSFDISGFSSERCPLYGGFVDIEVVTGITDGNNDDETHHTRSHLSVPYAGVACRLRDVPVLQSQSVNPVNYTFLTSATSQDPLGGPYAAEPVHPFQVFTLPGPKQYAQCEFEDICPEEQSRNEIHYPTLSLSMAMQSRAVTFKLIPVTLKVLMATTTSRRRGSSNAIATASEGTIGQGWPVFMAAATTDHPGGFSRVWTKYFAFNGQLADGSWAPAGAYLFQVCGVRAWDHPYDPEAFGDCVTTEPFVLRYHEGGKGAGDIGSQNHDHHEAKGWLSILKELELDYSVVMALLKVVFMLALFASLYALYGQKRQQPWHTAQVN